MTELVWDQTGDRFYEMGCDRGVLYSPSFLVEVEEGDGDEFSVGTISSKGFPWNGLISVEEIRDGASSEPLYFDGKKYYDDVTLDDFSAKLKAYTYPDEFMEFDGYAEFGPGMFVDSQMPGIFGLSYRTLIGNDETSDLGYKIHILYNLTAISDTVAHQTVDSNVEPITFSWTISGVPEEFPGSRPTAHFIIDSTKMSSDALTMLESILYGTETTDPRLPSIEELAYFTGVVITEFTDGTWSASGADWFVDMVDSDSFEIDIATVEYIVADEEFEISSTFE